MPEPRESERHLAMLIDGDNAQHSLLKEMLEEVSRYGTVTIRRAYGDWVQPNLANWRPAMLAHAIQPIQQWRYTSTNYTSASKNATDSALIIDAMDILYSGTVHGFCIVSSDSDYTRLCMRIRESGLFVMGMGRKLTPEAFINACNVFVYVENLNPSNEVKEPDEVKASVTPKKATTTKATTATATPKTPTTTKKTTGTKANPSQKVLLSLLRRAFDISAQDDEGWVHLGALGNSLQRIEPSFDSRTYGHKTLLLLVKSLPDQIVVKGAKKTGTSTIYVRMNDE